MQFLKLFLDLEEAEEDIYMSRLVKLGSEFRVSHNALLLEHRGLRAVLKYPSVAAL